MNSKETVSPFCWGRVNFLLMALALALVVSGFVLMTGPSCSLQSFEPDVFSLRRSVVAPTLCFVGYVLMIPGILYVSPAQSSSDHS
ncbi:MAG: DUF3098 domain-containing protein [Bacteroidales bacterium]|nr:DUF3098 domain-containing protein [Bacteroidales bacterium]MBP5214178.1 DUF3098 domain-containing protein [Bacteroidales bacterium]